MGGVFVYCDGKSIFYQLKMAAVHCRPRPPRIVAIDL